MSQDWHVHAPHHLWRWIAVGVIFAAFCWSEARAVDVTGVYVDAGSTTPPGAGQAAAPVSLQSLFTLEFDPILAAPEHSPADRVEITQGDPLLRIVCRDPSGAVTWSGQWKAGVGYGIEAGRVKLVFRSKRHDPDGFFFFLNHTGDQQLLVVEVQRVITSWFGPTTKPVGLYVFDRAPGGRPPQVPTGR